MISKAQVEAEIASSENELLGQFVVLSEWCPDNYLMERSDANVLLKYVDKEIKKRISVDRSTAGKLIKQLMRLKCCFQ